MNLKVLIATHKKFNPPKEDYFLPIHVGKEQKEDLGFLGDNTQDHISLKNNSFCELTGLYWAWKNLDFDVLGLCHYRRYFDIENNKDTINDIRFITPEEFTNYIFPKEKITQYLNKYDLILPKPKVYETSLEKDYGYCHSVIDYQLLTETITEISPEYSNTWNKVSHFSNKLYHYNMFIAPKNIVNEYCNWLFKLLFAVEKKVQFSPYTYDQRVFGFMAERLLTLYFTHNKFNIKHLPILYIKDEGFPYQTPSKIGKIASNSYNNFLFWLSTFPRKIKHS